MKNFYTLILSVLFSITGFAQFNVYTAVRSGDWDNSRNWRVERRNDGVRMNKIVIPNGITITANDDVNDLRLGDIEAQIAGVLFVEKSTRLDFGANSTIEILGNGEIVGENGSSRINFGSVEKYHGGKDGRKNGPAVADRNTSSSPQGFRQMGILPVEYTSFTVQKQNSQVLLRWTVAREISNNRFEIERSSNGNTWDKVGTIEGGGTHQSTVAYQFADVTSAAGQVFYRIRQVDQNGAYSFSEVRTVSMNSAVQNAAKVFFSARQQMNLQFAQPVQDRITVRVVNTNGAVVAQQRFDGGQAFFTMQVQHSANSGIYVVQVLDQNGLVSASKVMIP